MIQDIAVHLLGNRFSEFDMILLFDGQNLLKILQWSCSGMHTITICIYRERPFSQVETIIIYFWTILQHDNCKRQAMILRHFLNIWPDLLIIISSHNESRTKRMSFSVIYKARLLSCSTRSDHSKISSDNFFNDTCHKTSFLYTIKFNHLIVTSTDTYFDLKPSSVSCTWKVRLKLA